jgi:multidrug resistance efflux pump
LYVKKTNPKILDGIVVTKQIDIFSITPAKIEKLLIKENDFVKKDQLLVDFDSSILDTKIKEIQAKIDYESTKENLLKFKEEKALEEYLNCKKEQMQDLENDKLKLLEAIQQEHRLQKAKIESLKAKIPCLEKERQNLSIHSPCDGQIKDISVYINQNIQPSNKLFIISQNDHIWIKAKTKKTVKEFKIGDTFDIVFDDFPKVKFQGKIFSITDSIENDVQYVDLKLSFNQIKETPNEKTLLLADGMKAILKYE